MSNTVLEVSGIEKIFNKKDSSLKALNDISFSLEQGEILGIIGESGSGKSTLLKIIMGLEKATKGQINLNGKNIAQLKKEKEVYKNIQMVFQNPIGSFNPRKTMRASILRNMANLCPKRYVSEHNNTIDKLMEQVGIEHTLVERYPHQLSGGQCQRIAIARALATNPKIILCDEVTSALDVSVQALVIELLSKINQEFGVAIIFVSHDLSLAYHFCQKVIVMQRGNCIEFGNVKDVIENPQKDYTKELIASVIDPIGYLKNVDLSATKGRI